MALLVTGGAGFIGSNFINYYFPRLSTHFTHLINLDAMYYCAREDNIQPEIRQDSRYVFVKGNVNDTDLVTDVLNRYTVTHVMHFAAQSHVQNSFEDSIKFTEDNICGTHTLLECCRKWGKIIKFVHVSTDEVYGESMKGENERQKTEHSVLCPTNPYAATKAGAELLAQSYYHSYKFPVIITRGNNVYGPNQYPEKLIPLFIKLLTEGKKVTIQGDGSCVRSFLHAYDTATAFGLILDRGTIGEIYNIGCDEGMEYSVMDIAKILIKGILGTEAYAAHIDYIPDRPFNDQRYYISNDKLKALGWQITTDLMTGLNGLVEGARRVYQVEQPAMRVLIYGAKGWIGGQFEQILKNAQVDYICGVNRCDDFAAVQTEVSQVRPTHVISFIGRTHGPGYSTIDYLEQKGKLCQNIQDNLYAPLVLAEICQQEGLHYTYLGTGCIFTYDETHPLGGPGFTEADRPNFFGSGYSTVKGFTDQLLSRRPVLNLRIRMPITGEENPRNFITKITHYDRICSVENSMTVLPELLPLVLRMMRQGTRGTVNLTNPGAISHNEILAMYKALVDPDFTWTNFTVEEQSKILASERSNNCLDTVKLQTLFPEITPIKDAVRACLLGYKRCAE